jgi:hypothetical protein
MVDENMAAKLAMPEFIGDTESYLRDGIAFDPNASWHTVREKLFEKIVNVDLK